jgi:hypothetical protein
MSINYVLLKTEINTDPKNLGYAQHVLSGNDQEIATLLNTLGASNETISREEISPSELVNNIVYSEWVSTTTDQKTYLNMVLATGKIDALNTNVRAGLLAMFGTGTTSRANLIDISTRPASRAESLFGRGTIITNRDVAKAIARLGTGDL